MKKKVELLCFDPKVWDILDSFETALKSFGLKLTVSPGAEGSNGFVFYLSNYKLSKKELKALDKEFGVDPFDEPE